ncbi:hypothetical protein EDD85DRAFT_790592 [Armillaria nabsnona]|nr:hypothetical protein EDD85DRAFT_790592 [Armillaria nabsnona]
MAAVVHVLVLAVGVGLLLCFVKTRPVFNIEAKTTQIIDSSQADSLANAINVMLNNGTSILMEQPNKGHAPTSKSDAAHIDDVNGEVNTTGCKGALAKRDGSKESSELLGKKRKADSEEEEEDEAPKSNASGNESPAESNTKEAKRNCHNQARSRCGKKAVLCSKARRPALKSTLIEAPAILGHKHESHAAMAAPWSPILDKLQDRFKMWEKTHPTIEE